MSFYDLQALRVVIIGLLASAAAGTHGGARVADAATLAVLGLSGNGLASSSRLSASSRRLSARSRRSTVVSRATCGGGISGVEIAPPEVAVGHLDATTISLDICWGARGTVTRATVNARLGVVSVQRVIAVEPEHVGEVVIPNGKSKNHAG